MKFLILYKKLYLGSALLNWSLSDPKLNPRISAFGLPKTFWSILFKLSLAFRLRRSMMKASFWPLIWSKLGFVFHCCYRLIFHSESTPMKVSVRSDSSLKMSSSVTIQLSVTPAGNCKYSDSGFDRDSNLSGCVSVAISKVFLYMSTSFFWFFFSVFTFWIWDLWCLCRACRMHVALAKSAPCSMCVLYLKSSSWCASRHFLVCHLRNYSWLEHIRTW